MRAGANDRKCTSGRPLRLCLAAPKSRVPHFQFLSSEVCLAPCVRRTRRPEACGVDARGNCIRTDNELRRCPLPRGSCDRAAPIPCVRLRYPPQFANRHRQRCSPTSRRPLAIPPAPGPKQTAKRRSAHVSARFPSHSTQHIALQRWPLAAAKLLVSFLTANFEASSPMSAEQSPP